MITERRRSQYLSITMAIKKWQAGAFSAACPVCLNQKEITNGQNGNPKQHKCAGCPVSSFSGHFGCVNTPFIDDEPDGARGVSYLEKILEDMRRVDAL